jgi:hypothetical protein
MSFIKKWIAKLFNIKSCECIDTRQAYICPSCGKVQ